MSILLAAVLLLGAMPLTAFAGDIPQVWQKAVSPGAGTEEVLLAPTEDGVYLISSVLPLGADENCDPYIDGMVDANGDAVDCTDLSEMADEGAKGFGVACSLTGGETYTLTVGDGGATDSSFVVMVMPTPMLSTDSALTATLSNGSIYPVAFIPPEDGIYEITSSHDGTANPEIRDYAIYTGADYTELISRNDADDVNNVQYIYALQGGALYLWIFENYFEDADSTSGVTYQVSVAKKEAETALKLGESLTLVPGADPTYVSFTPETDGFYRFASRSIEEADPVMMVFDEDLEWVEPDRGYQDDVYDSDFWAVYELEAGVTYTLYLEDFGASEKGFAVTVSPYYQVEKQPTATDLSVEATFAGLVKGYQWYTAISESVLLTADSDRLFYWYNEQVAETGVWKPDGEPNELDEGGYEHYLFNVYLKEGETLTVESSDAILLEDSRLNGMERTEKELVNEKTIRFTAITEEENYLYMATTGENSTFKLTLTTDAADKKVDGQTTDTLTAYKRDTAYLCVITYQDGSTVLSEPVVIVSDFIKQPTAGNPSVAVTYADEVKSYQWYSLEFEGELLTPESDIVSYDAEVSYDPATGGWNSYAIYIGDREEYEYVGLYGYDLLDVKLKAGEQITVIGSDPIHASDGYFGVEGSDSSGKLEQIDAYTVLLTATEDAIYSFGVSSDGDDTAFLIATGNGVVAEKLDGQTTDTLTAYEKNGLYRCVVTYENGDELISRTARMALTIVKQPTAEAPSVEVTFADEVKSYQWYTAVEKVNPLTPESDGVLRLEYEASYDETTGKWSALSLEWGKNYFYGMLYVLLEEGESIRIKGSDPIIAEESYLINYNTYLRTDVVQLDANTVLMTAPEKGIYYVGLATGGTQSVFEIASSAVVADKALEGQTAAALTECEAGTMYLCEVTYADGTVLTTEVFTATEESKVVIAAGKVTDLIEALPETITKDDAAAIDAAEKAYNALSDEAKALIDADVLKKLTDAKAALAALNAPQSGGNGGSTADKPESPDSGDSPVMPMVATVVLVLGMAALVVVLGKKRTAKN